MCKLCDEGQPQDHGADEHRWNSRRGFLKASSATAPRRPAPWRCSSPPAARGRDDDREPEDSGHHGRRYVIRGGAVMSMDPKVGDFAEADVLVEGKKIVAVGPNLHAGGAAVIDARGRIVMPGFIDTHHHQFETALRSFLADGVLINDGSDSPSAQPELLPEHPADVRAGVPAAGRVHQRAVRRAEPARRRRDDGARHLADPPLAGAPRRRRSRRCSTPSAAPCSATSRAPAASPATSTRPTRGASRSSASSSSDQLLHDVHGRRDLPGDRLRAGVDDRPRARPADRGAHRRRLRHAADLRRAGRWARAAQRRTSASARTTCSST